MAKILSMTMTSKKRMRVIREANAEQYFAMLDEQKQMSRNEKNALRFQGQALRQAAAQYPELRNEWNNAARTTGNKNQIFHVSIG